MEAEEAKKTYFEEHVASIDDLSKFPEIKAAYEEYELWEPNGEVSPSDYILHVFTDSIGNNTDAEYLDILNKYVPMTYRFYEQLIGDYDCRYIKGFCGPINNMEVYNSYFGGYNIEYGYNYVVRYIGPDSSYTKEVEHEKRYGKSLVM